MDEGKVNIAEALRTATARLAATSDTARLDAELLMVHTLGVTRSELLLRHMRDPVPAVFPVLVERRAQHEPVAYITGHQEFFGRSFEVTPDTLIPRGDSETLIEAALVCRPDARRVLDLGTGTGALLLTFLAESEAAGIGIDASAPACEIAAHNAAALGLQERTRFLHRDWTQPGWTEELGTFDLVLCNPPYVEEGAALDPSVRDYEPAGALFSGPDGLDDYRVLIPQLPALLNPGGVAVFEIGHRQADAVTALAQAHGFSVELRRDLGGRPRALVLTR